MLGHIYLKRNIMEIVRDVFKDMKFYKIKKLTKKESSNIGDRTYVVHCGKNDGKKIISFEIKSGHTHIHQGQLRKQCMAILNPSKFIKKANEWKVFYVFFNPIHSLNDDIEISICELDKNLAERILNSEPERQVLHN